MRTFGKTILAAAVVLAVLAGGCGDDKKCAAESPEVNAVATSCDVPAGQAVNFPLRLCPTCNQTLTGCSADMSAANAGGGRIFLNPTVEACDSAASCPGACDLRPATCTFTPPSTAAGVSYEIEVYDPVSNKTKLGTVTFVSSNASCAITG